MNVYKIENINGKYCVFIEGIQYNFINHPKKQNTLIYDAESKKRLIERSRKRSIQRKILKNLRKL